MTVFCINNNSLNQELVAVDALIMNLLGTQASNKNSALYFLLKTTNSDDRESQEEASPIITIFDAFVAR